MPCSTCGSIAAGQVAGRLCPACLMRLAMADEAGDTRPVEQHSEYRMLAVLDVRETATVYLAEQRPGNRLVVLETLGTAGRTGDMAAVFESRLLDLMGLTHPGIAAVLDGRVSASGEPSLVTAYVPGPSIDRYCESRNAPAAERVALLIQACRAVAYAASRGVSHGRLVPASIVIAKDGEGEARPVVTGFGLAVPGEPGEDGRALGAILERLVPDVARQDSVRACLDAGSPSVAALLRALEEI